MPCVPDSEAERDLLLLAEVHRCLSLYALALYAGMDADRARLFAVARHPVELVEAVANTAEKFWKRAQLRGMSREDFVRTILKEEGFLHDEDRVH